MYKGDKKGGAGIDNGLMKQEILSQVLQILSNNKNIDVPALQQKINELPQSEPMVQQGEPMVQQGEPLVQQGHPLVQPLDRPLQDQNNIVNIPNKPNIQEQPIQRDMPINKPVIDEIVPNCTAIAKDNMDGKINETNFIYLSPQCDTQIMNALKSSQ